MRQNTGGNRGERQEVDDIFPRPSSADGAYHQQSNPTARYLDEGSDMNVCQNDAILETSSPAGLTVEREAADTSINMANNPTSRWLYKEVWIGTAGYTVTVGSLC